MNSFQTSRSRVRERAEEARDLAGEASDSRLCGIFALPEGECRGQAR